MEKTLTINNSAPLEIIVNFNHNLKINISEDSKLSDLRTIISKEFMMKEDEYDIYIKNLLLLIINQDLKIKSLVEQYGDDTFIIKAYKSN